MDSNIEKIITAAIDREKEANRYYNKAASLIEDSNGRLMYHWLAREELGHATLLQVELNAIKRGEGWLAEKNIKDAVLSDPVDCSKIPIVSETKPTQSTCVDDMAILKEAVESEKAAVLFYKDLAAKTADAKGKLVLRKLAKIEKGHQGLLEKQLKRLSNSQNMFMLEVFDIQASS